MVEYLETNILDLRLSFNCLKELNILQILMNFVILGFEILLKDLSHGFEFETLLVKIS